MRDQLERERGARAAARAGWIGVGAVVAHGVLLAFFVRSELNDFNPPNRHPLWAPEPELPHGLELAAFVVTALAAVLIARAVWRAVRCAGVEAFGGWRALGLIPVAWVAMASVLVGGGAWEELAERRAHGRFVDVAGERRLSGDWLEVDGERLYVWDGRRRSRVEDAAATLPALAAELEEGEWLVVEVDGVGPAFGGRELLVAALGAGIRELVFVPAGGPLAEVVWSISSADLEGPALGLSVDASGTPGAGVWRPAEVARAAEPGAAAVEFWRAVTTEAEVGERVLDLRERWAAEGRAQLTPGRLVLGPGVPFVIWAVWMEALAAEGEPVQVVLLEARGN